MRILQPYDGLSSFNCHRIKRKKSGCQKTKFNYFCFELVRDIGFDKDDILLATFKFFNGSSAKKL